MKCLVVGSSIRSRGDFPSLFLILISALASSSAHIICVPTLVSSCRLCISYKTQSKLNAEFNYQRSVSHHNYIYFIHMHAPQPPPPPPPYHQPQPHPKVGSLDINTFNRWSENFLPFQIQHNEQIKAHKKISVSRQVCMLYYCWTLLRYKASFTQCQFATHRTEITIYNNYLINYVMPI